MATAPVPGPYLGPLQPTGSLGARFSPCGPPPRPLAPSLPPPPGLLGLASLASHMPLAGTPALFCWTGHLCWSSFPAYCSYVTLVLEEFCGLLCVCVLPLRFFFNFLQRVSIPQGLVHAVGSEQMSE